MQLILTYIIIFGAISYVIYKIYTEFIQSKTGSSCSGSCTQCSTKNDIIAQAKFNKKFAFKAVAVHK